MLIRQIRSVDGTGTLSYMIADENEHVGILIDPNIEDLERIEKLKAELDLRITHIIDTHTHADHVSAAGELRARTGAQNIMHANTINKWKIIDQGDEFGIGDTLRANAKIPTDRFVDDGDVVTSGSLHAAVLFTPGHTDNHICIHVEDNLFTGDLLLIGQAGRSDLPGGNPEEQYDSLFQRVLPLPERTRIYPGHDYQDQEFSTLREEKRANPFLQQRSRQQFAEFVKEFFPPIAESTATGGKMTLQCGVQRVMQPGEAVTGITASELHAMRRDGESLLVLDVREPIELTMSGAIEGVINIPIRKLKSLGERLPMDKDTPIVCVCQSGIRSLEAAHYLQREGYTNVKNLVEGTSGWIRSGFPVVRTGQFVV